MALTVVGPTESFVTRGSESLSVSEVEVVLLLEDTFHKTPPEGILDQL